MDIVQQHHFEVHVYAHVFIYTILSKKKEYENRINLVIKYYPNKAVNDKQ